jgi:hypothetical protein
MPMPSAMSTLSGVKNMSVPGQAAPVSIGAGDQLQQQVTNEILARRKKALSMANTTPAAYGALAMGTGLNTGGAGSGSSAYQALMGQGGFNG